MKNLTQVLAFALITVLFATAFTTLGFDHQARLHQVKSGTQESVARVVIVGKRMSTQEKADYDAEMLAQTLAKQ